MARFFRSIAASRVRAIRIALKAGDCAGAERRLDALFHARKKHHEPTVKGATLARLLRRVDRCQTGLGRSRRRRKR